MSNGTKWTAEDVARLGMKKAKNMSQAEFREWNRVRFANRKHTTLKDEGDFVTLRIDYKGDLIGLNEYKTMHWTKLRRKYKPIKDAFFELIASQRPPSLSFFELYVYHNTDYDIDNLTGTVKPFVDALRGLGVAPEDDKRYWDHLSIRYAPQIEKGSVVFEVKGYKKKKI